MSRPVTQEGPYSPQAKSIARKLAVHGAQLLRTKQGWRVRKDGQVLVNASVLPELSRWARRWIEREEREHG